MTLTIDGKEYTLHFGLDFIRTMDQIYRGGNENYNFGMGINSAVVYLEQLNPVILLDLIHAGLITEKQRPSKAKIEEFILARTWKNFVMIFSPNCGRVPQQKEWSKS